MNEDKIDFVRKSIIHIKSRPTLKAISKLYITLNSIGYNVNKLNYDEYNYDSILKYCNYIEKFVKENNLCNINTPKNKYIHVKFKENILIPQNVNINDEDNEDDKDYQANGGEYSVMSESDSEVDSEQNIDDVDADVDAEYYDSGNDEFSD
jgi:hypothetical protein